MNIVFLILTLLGLSDFGEVHNNILAWTTVPKMDGGLTCFHIDCDIFETIYPGMFGKFSTAIHEFDTTPSEGNHPAFNKHFVQNLAIC